MRSRRQIEKQASANRRSLLAAEAEAKRELRSRRAEVEHRGPDRVYSAVRSAIIDVRVSASEAGLRRVIAEANAVGSRLIGGLDNRLAQAAETLKRADIIARSHAKRWAAAGGGRAAAAHLEQVAVTESAHAFAGARAKFLRAQPALGLLRVWDSTLDRRTCPICSGLDGEIVGARENFPHGEAPIHPWCRCSWTLLTPSEADGIVTYEARRPTVQVAETVAPRRERKPLPKPHPGYLAENRQNTRKAIAYERMLESRAIPHAVRDAKRTKQFRRIIDGGLSMDEFDSMRLGFRESSFEAVERAFAGGDATAIATGRIIPKGSRTPLPEIRLSVEPDGKVNVIDGRHRLITAKKHGAKKIRAKIFFYDSELDDVWVGVRNIPIPK